MLRRVGEVQLDTISVLARSHELVAYARLGAVGREAVEDAYWGRPAHAFEALAHAMCILPIELWPHFAARRRQSARWVHPRRPPDDRAMREVLAELKARGPLTATDLGGSRSKAPRPPTVWWHWSAEKIALERLLAIGTVVCVERRAWKRVYDLVERAIPAKLRAPDEGDETCGPARVGRRAGRLGPGRMGTTLVAKRVSGERGSATRIARALVEAARWVGCDDVQVLEARPASLKTELRAALRARR